jgi:hypothetical protein
MKHQHKLCRTLFSIFIFLFMLSFSYSQVPTVSPTTVLANLKYAGNSLDMAAGYSAGVTTIYYCTDGGFYKSTNDGTAWTAITTLSPLPKVIACEAANPNIIYAADGSTFLKKSTNGGTSWINILGTITNLSISRITVVPSPDNQRVYVGCNVSG